MDGEFSGASEVPAAPAGVLIDAGQDVLDAPPINVNVNLELLLDVDLPVSIAFGTSEMTIKDALKLGTGAVIELNKSVNDPVTIIVNQKPIARGEVVMIDGNYGVRVLEVESTADRIMSLG
jgi:flagellar motor switch protein FliN/FliY